MNEKNELTIAVPLPPTINHYYASRGVGGARRLTDAARHWRESVSKIAWYAVRQGRIVIPPPYCVHIWASLGKADDIDNRIKPLLDALQHGQVIVNDRDVVELVVRKLLTPKLDDRGVLVRVFPFAEAFHVEPPALTQAAGWR
jgi:Holliday junction resolvase RusA-like endonuclease